LTNQVLKHYFQLSFSIYKGERNMESMWMAKQLIDFQKTTFNNAYQALMMLQDHTEKVTNTMVEQAKWFPEESLRIAGLWTDFYKKGQHELKNAIEDHLEQMSEQLSPKG